MSAESINRENASNTVAAASFLKAEEVFGDIITYEDSDAVFECKIVGNPTPVVSWFKDGCILRTNQRKQITSQNNRYSLKILDTDLNDIGVYNLICVNSRNQLSLSGCLYITPVNINQTVLYTMQTGRRCNITEHLRNITVMIGGTIELASIFSERIIDFQWYKNNDRILQNDRIIILTSDNTSHLTILRAVPADAGVYTVIATSENGIVSSMGHVQVMYDSKLILNKPCPDFDEMLPDELETNEGEEIRIICKPYFNVNTSVTWLQDEQPISEIAGRIVAEEYGCGYIGLKITRASSLDTASYTVLLHDHESNATNNCSCYLTVVPGPSPFYPDVSVKKPLEHVLACPGAKIIFDCSFELEETLYFYVVWYLGRYKIERTNSQFKVIQNGRDFFLYIKKLELDMTGEITCELRRAQSGQRSTFVTRTRGDLAIVPPLTILNERERNSDINAYTPKLYNASTDEKELKIHQNPDEYSPPSSRQEEEGAAAYPEPTTDPILEIIYFRVEKDGLYYVRAVRGEADVGIRNLTVCDSTNGNVKVVVFKWVDSLPSRYTWYCIEMEQNDVFVPIHYTLRRYFEVELPPVDLILKMRVRNSEPAPGYIPTSRLLVPNPPVGSDEGVKDLQVKPMEEFHRTYTNTGNVVGKGAFGSVVLVKDEKGSLHAAKIIKTRTQKRRDTAMREFEVMKKLRHPKLVELSDAFFAKDSFVLVMDYLWGGELFDRIVDEEHIKEADVVPYVRQICEGLQYLHSLKIAHLDVKPENIVCLSPNSREIKIIDFGLARIIEDSHMTRAIYGTRDYVAPEVLNFERLTIACDMWSLGVVTYMLLSGVMPFSGNTWPERSANITLANYNYDDVAFNEISDLAKDFVDKLLIITAAQRLTAKTALEHKWITEGPSRETKAGHMKKTRENLKSYLANNRARWQRAGNVMIAAHRLRTHAVLRECDAKTPRVT